MKRAAMAVITTVNATESVHAAAPVAASAPLIA
jgi:hypothetical protein